MDGILNVNKPPHQTSFSVVALVKRWSGVRRVGHAGTLDPLATGVLPVCLGQGTRVIQFLAEGTKTYRAEVEFGVSTDTYDASGKVVYQGDSSRIERGQLESALASFRGLIQQTPPMYSAVRYQGKRLYEYARAGIQVERKARPARIHSLELVAWAPPVATVEVVCDKGTYVRSLAHDLGQAVGCGAHLKNLVRLRYGPFDVRDAVSLPELEDAFRYGYWWRFIEPIDIVLLDWMAAIVDEEKSRAIASGRPLRLTESSTSEACGDELGRCRAYSAEGCFTAVLYFDREQGYWHPEKVFRTA